MRKKSISIEELGGHEGMKGRQCREDKRDRNDDENETSSGADHDLATHLRVNGSTDVRGQCCNSYSTCSRSHELLRKVVPITGGGGWERDQLMKGVFLGGGEVRRRGQCNRRRVHVGDETMENRGEDLRGEAQKSRVFRDQLGVGNDGEYCNPGEEVRLGLARRDLVVRSSYRKDWNARICCVKRRMLGTLRND